MGHREASLFSRGDASRNSRFRDCQGGLGRTHPSGEQLLRIGHEAAGRRAEGGRHRLGWKSPRGEVKGWRMDVNS